MSRLTHIKLDNFTSFAGLDEAFSTGVNVIIGANGTGKTHLLKVLYAACAVTVGEDREKSFALKLRSVFNPYEGRMGRLARRQSTSVKTRATVTRQGGAKLAAEFSNHTNKPEDVKVTGETSWKKEELASAYIPVKEMLAHAPGFLATAAKREIAFEEVYVDIIKRAFLPRLMGPIDKDRQRLLTALQKAIDGKVVAKGEHFFLKNKQGDLEFTLLAEGMRKLALIWLLIQNGTLLSGSVLFWDEPEANLNPALMGEVVEVILELQRMGVQVFLTTHNYVLLKEFDLRKQKDDQIRYLSLFRDESEAVTAKASDSYLGVDPNAIAATFSDLYDRELKRSLGGHQAVTVLAEDDLQITLPAGVTGRKFDDETSHGLSHCMKAVDFIVELDDRTYFVEFKDPENPKAKPKDSAAFLKKFMSGAIDSDLKTKYRDSWLYEYAEGRAKKPIYYLVLIGASMLSDADLLTRTEALKRQLPAEGPNDRPWGKPFVAGCAVMNLAAWSKTLAHMPASRVGREMEN